ncbi:MAG TPA: excinuclease ABC subunit C [Amoebophilaceae bacterium]|nr:excinuclease ABC subunit C [Amoebophilaceae bacterium]
MEVKKYTPKDIHLLAPQPGVYRFYNKQDTLIYVGKAKNIKKRVSSYFSSSKQHSLKTRRMVAEITTIECTLVNSEYEALLLENNLIKKSQPRYNILLKDDRTYPYLCITKERFPRVIPTRKVSPQLGQYYGPFTDLRAMYRILALIKQLYPLRTCAYSLTAENVFKGKFKVCLEYHLGNCKGPCEGLQEEASYNQDIAQIEYLLKGHLNAVKKDLREKMCQAAQALAYEEAQTCKEKLDALTTYQVKSLVINPKVGDLDVFGMVSDEQAAFVSYLQIKNGAISFTQTVELKKKLDEEDGDLLPRVILNFREKYSSTATEVLTNLPLSIDLNTLAVTVPKIGDKKKLVMMAVKNALFFKKERFIKNERYQEKANKILLLLQQDLQLQHLPLHIECFDNSNLQGSHPVAAMVCFKNGKPARSEYRHFNIKTVTGPDDFASMSEVVHRRYTRLISEKKDLPDLIVIDGGKGQLSAVVAAMKAIGIYGQVPVIGIAKRLEEIYYPEDPYPIHISKQAASLKLIQQIRNEAHRFAISLHINKRSKASLQSELEAIPGIGPKTIEKLLLHFKSIKHIKSASTTTLAQQIGNKKAALLKTHLEAYS